MAGTASHEEEALGKAYDARLMRRLLAYLRPHRGRVTTAVLVLLAAAAVELTGPILTKIALDSAIPDGDVPLLLLLSAALLASLLLAFVLEAVQTIITTWLGQHVMYDLRRQIFGHLQRLPLPYFDCNPVGRTMTRVTSDVEVLNELFSSGVVSIFGDVFTLLLIVTAMFIMDWQLALVTLTVMPFVFAVAIIFRSRIREAYRDVRVRLARINSFLQEHISGVAVVQLFGRERAADEQFRRINEHYLAAHLRSIRYYAMFFPIIEILTAIALAAIITYGGFEVMGGAVSIGTVAAFLQFARRFFRPIQDLSEKYNMLQGAMASSERIFTLLDTEPIGERDREWGRSGERGWEGGDQTTTARARGSGGAGAAGSGLPVPGAGEIEFRNVWFAYVRSGDEPGAEWEWVLRDVSFRVRAGEKVAIVGHTGAGKTSIISLLLRFYEPQRGEILFDGVPIRDAPVHDLRERIGLVLQDVFLFSRDIDYNIRLGRTDMSEERVEEAARRVGADALIARLPGGYGEQLGERGANLSVGERQLLSFARALAFEPQVLILDEATSSVDSALEHQIDEALAELMHGRTSIIVAHRLSTVQNADRIIVLHHGELREEGTHAALLRQRGLYARLHELQFAGADRHLNASSHGSVLAPSGAEQAAPADSAEEVA
ncbi:MAG TPA: ABC transporter ATP-binding protein [Longimicrobiales bacterium]|nr:ABC transporter ATP-binding protein [Longimicrobiales bacterium]